MSRILVDQIRSNSASADAITLDGSGNVTFPANATCSGTATGFGGGKVVQVIQHLDTADYSTTGTSYVQGPQTPTFTLSNSSNKVLVLCNWMAFMDARSGGTISVRNAIYRGSVASGTLLNTGDQPMQFFGNTVNFEYYMGHSFLQWLDTPGGNTTYSLAVRNAASSSNSAKIRGTQQTTSITLMEIAV